MNSEYGCDAEFPDADMQEAFDIRMQMEKILGTSVSIAGIMKEAVKKLSVEVLSVKK